MRVTIRSGDYLTQRTFENTANFEASDSERLLVDLKPCGFADIYALVTLLTIITLARDEDVPVQILLPASSNVANYLDRMGFYDLLPRGVECDRLPPQVSKRDAALVPLTRFDTRHGGESAVEELCNFAYERLSGSVASSFTDALWEIGVNVVHHSEADVGFVAAQRYPRTSTLHFVVGDAGIGVRESLARGRPEARAMDDPGAISLALQAGVSGKPGHSGVGLSTVYDLSQSMSIRSGAGLVWKGFGGPFHRLVPDVAGTIVSATVGD